MSTPQTILVADDDEDIRMLIVTKLERAGYRVVPASDGDEALELTRRERPDLALLDVMMPGLDGLQVASAIRADPDLADTRVAVLTARARDIDVSAGYAAGADEYIIKPFSPRQLVERVNDLLAQG